MLLPNPKSRCEKIMMILQEQVEQNGQTMKTVANNDSSTEDLELIPSRRYYVEFVSGFQRAAVPLESEEESILTVSPRSCM